MRGVVGGDLFEHQRALTVVKMFPCARPRASARGLNGIEETGERKRLSPFFLFGVAIERVGDQVVNTCSASEYVSPAYLRQNSRLYGISCSIVGICLSRFVLRAAPIKMVFSGLLPFIDICTFIDIPGTESIAKWCLAILTAKKLKNWINIYIFTWYILKIFTRSARVYINFIMLNKIHLICKRPRQVYYSKFKKK